MKIKNFRSLKFVTLIIVAASLATLFVQSASAMVSIDVIDTKYETVSATWEKRGLPSGISSTAKFESWMKLIETNWGSSEYRWITVGYGSTATISTGGGGGAITISFDPYITISYVEVGLYWGLGSASIIYGGVGYSYVAIDAYGAAAFYYYIRTNNIPKNYWGSTTGIGFSAASGMYSQYKTVYLRI